MGHHFTSSILSDKLNQISFAYQNIFHFFVVHTLDDTMPEYKGDQYHLHLQVLLAEVHICLLHHLTELAISGWGFFYVLISTHYRLPCMKDLSKNTKVIKGNEWFTTRSFANKCLDDTYMFKNIVMLCLHLHTNFMNDKDGTL